MIDLTSTRIIYPSADFRIEPRKLEPGYRGTLWAGFYAAATIDYDGTIEIRAERESHQHHSTRRRYAQQVATALFGEGASISRETRVSYSLRADGRTAEYSHYTVTLPARGETKHVEQTRCGLVQSDFFGPDDTEVCADGGTVLDHPAN